MPLIGRQLDKVKPAGHAFSGLVREVGPSEQLDIIVDEAVPMGEPADQEPTDKNRFIVFSTGMVDVPLALITAQEVEGDTAHVTFEAKETLAEHPGHIGALLTRSIPRRLGVDHVVLSLETDTTLSADVLQRAGGVAVAGNPSMVEFAARAA